MYDFRDVARQRAQIYFLHEFSPERPISELGGSKGNDGSQSSWGHILSAFTHGVGTVTVSSALTPLSSGAYGWISGAGVAWGPWPGSHSRGVAVNLETGSEKSLAASWWSHFNLGISVLLGGAVGVGVLGDCECATISVLIGVNNAYNQEQLSKLHFKFNYIICIHNYFIKSI